MALFEIYTKKRGFDDKNEHILIYRDKISYTALIFPPLWFLLNKNFFLIPFYIAILFLLFGISAYFGSSIIIFGIIFIHLFLIKPTRFTLFSKDLSLISFSINWL